MIKITFFVLSKLTVIQLNLQCTLLVIASQTYSVLQSPKTKAKNACVAHQKNTFVAHVQELLLLKLRVWLVSIFLKDELRARLIYEIRLKSLTFRAKTGLKETKKETNKQRNKETKKQKNDRKKERKKQRNKEKKQ